MLFINVEYHQTHLYPVSPLPPYLHLCPGPLTPASASGLSAVLEPYVLWNGMIHPLLQYRIKGVLWYQGESNAGNATAYSCAFPALIRSWRSHWQQGDFPFYFILLSGYPEGGSLYGPRMNES